MENKKYYFFRDLDNRMNYMDGKTYHAYGLVDEIYSKTPTPSGKDLSVWHFNCFEGMVISEWRTYDEVELFEVYEYE